MFNKLDIVARIEAAIKAIKLPATRFAEAMGGRERGYTKDTVRNWRNGKSTSYMNDLQEIADLLNVTAHWLLTGNEPQARQKNKKEGFIMVKRFLSKKGKHCIHEALDICFGSAPKELAEYFVKSCVTTEQGDVLIKIASFDGNIDELCDNFSDEDFPVYLQLATMAHLSDVSSQGKVRAALDVLQEEQKIIELHEKAAESVPLKQSS